MQGPVCLVARAPRRAACALRPSCLDAGTDGCSLDPTYVLKNEVLTPANTFISADTYTLILTGQQSTAVRRAGGVCVGGVGWGRAWQSDTRGRARRQLVPLSPGALDCNTNPDALEEVDRKEFARAGMREQARHGIPWTGVGNSLSVASVSSSTQNMTRAPPPPPPALQHNLFLYAGEGRVVLPSKAEVAALEAGGADAPHYKGCILAEQAIFQGDVLEVGSPHSGCMLGCVCMCVPLLWHCCEECMCACVHTLFTEFMHELQLHGVCHRCAPKSPAPPLALAPGVGWDAVRRRVLPRVRRTHGSRRAARPRWRGKRSPGERHSAPPAGLQRVQFLRRQGGVPIR